MKIYISGKISGLDQEKAKEKFRVAKGKLQFAFPEAEVIDPMELVPYHPDLTWENYMGKDLEELLSCDAILMLPCWAKSRGARIEYAVAKELGITIMFEEDLMLNKI